MTSAIITLAGEIDLDKLPATLQQVEQALADGATQITFDLLDVTFFDSTGLGVVIAAANACEVTVINVAPHIRRSFEITGIDYLIGEP